MGSKMSVASGPGCLLRAVGAYLVFALLSLAVAIGCGYWLSSQQMAEAEKAWAREFEPMEALAARFPRQTDSEAAKALDAAARPLGIAFIRRPDDDSTKQDSRFEALQDVGKALSDAGVKPFSPPAASLLSREVRQISTVADQILQGGPLHWELDLDRGPGAPVPSLLAHRQLQSLLLARAHLDGEAGRTGEALEALEASWRLNASIIERPETLCQLIACAVSGMQDGVLRSMHHLPPVWIDRMRERPFSQNMTRFLQIEVWQMTRLSLEPWGVLDLGAIDSGNLPSAGFAGKIVRYPTVPFLRFALADYSVQTRVQASILRAERGCGLDIQGLSAEIEKSTPRWSVLTRISLPTLLRAWTAMREADLRRELTGRVIEARAERAATGHWPAGTLSSEVCEGLDWLSTVDRTGALVIRAAQDPFFAPLPTRKLEHRLTP